jgi:hypothetical protein
MLSLFNLSKSSSYYDVSRGLNVGWDWTASGGGVSVSGIWIVYACKGVGSSSKKGTLISEALSE